MRARLTLVGMENYLNHKEKSINDTWSLKDIEAFDKDTLLASIIYKGGTFEPLYTDPDFFYNACSYFWKKWNRTFTKWFEAFAVEYNPLENYDRHESWNETHEDSGTIDTTEDRTSSSSETTDNDITTENSVSAFDSSSYSDRDKTVSENDISVSGSSTDNNVVGTETANEGTIEHEGHLHGNIGVTTSQEMLKSELEIQGWNIYEHIADIFIKELCIAVY